MSILHPWAIYLGLAAVGLPVLVHFLTRPRPVRFPLSTMRFVRQAIQQRRARNRLRDFLVLLLRTAAVLLAALALSRPWWGDRPVAVDSVANTTVRVVLLDVSQSMGEMQGGIQLLERARPIVGEYLQYQPRLSANLILAAARAESPLSQPSGNLALLRDELARAQVCPERLNVRSALERAATMLTPVSAEDQRERELVIVSDFQRGNWSVADFSAFPPDTEIRFESVAPAEHPANLAVLRAGCRGRATPGRNVRLEVEVANYSPADRNLHVNVRLGTANYKLNGLCPAGRTAVLASDVQFPEPGWLLGEARLVDVEDSLAADNVRPLVVEVRPKPLYALVTLQDASKRPSSSHYLDCALVPDANLGDAASARVVRVNPEKLDLEVLAPADLIVLDHPGKLSDSAIQILSSLMRRGRSLLYVAAETIDATNLRRLQDAAGRGLQMPVEFQPPPAHQLRRDLFLTTIAKSEPLFQIYGESAMTLLGRSRFGGGLASRPLEQGLRSDVLATLNDGSVLLVHTASDGGQLAVLNADLEQSNIGSLNVMALLVDGLVQRLLSGSGNAASFRSGEMVRVQLPPDSGTADTLKIFGTPGATWPRDGAPSGDDALGTLADDGAGVLWTWPNPWRPGTYRVERGGKTTFALAIEPPGEEESRFETLPAEVLTSRLAAGRQVHYRSSYGEGEHATDNSWVVLLASCMICLLGELGVLSLFRS